MKNTIVGTQENAAVIVIITWDVYQNDIVEFALKQSNTTKQNKTKTLNNVGPCLLKKVREGTDKIAMEKWW